MLMDGLEPCTGSVPTSWAVLAENAGKMGERAALLEPDGPQLSYAELWSRVRAVEGALRGDGEPRVVALVAGNRPPMLVALMGAMRAGVAAPLNPALTDAELEEQLRRVGAESVIGEEARTERLAARLGLNYWPLDALYNSAAAEAATEPDARRVVLTQFTSATSGRAKMVEHRLANLDATFAQSVRAVGVNTRDRVLMITPLFHTQGIITSLSTLRSGGLLVVPRGADAPRVARWIVGLEITSFTGGPTFQRALYEHLKAHPLGENRLRFARSSGAPLSAEAIARAHAVLGAPLMNNYGLTETGAISLMTPEIYESKLRPTADGPRLPEGLVGRSAGLRIEIRDAEGRALPPGEAGEIVVRGPSVMAGYRDDPGEALRDGWFHTGDLGRLDAEGLLYITGRVKEMINRGGQKVAPVEVEMAASAHPAVREATAFALPHRTLGEDVALAVVLHSGAAATEEELRNFVRQRLAFYKTPRRIFVVEAIPLGPTGKPLRRVLAERFAAETARNERGPVDGEQPQTALYEIWCRLLSNDHADYEGDFFAEGGDSLGAMALLAEVEARFQAPVTAQAAEFFDRPTLARLVELVERCAEPQAGLLPGGQMRAYPVRGGTRGPLVCIPANGDEGLYFRRMAQALDPARGVLIVRPENTWHERDTHEMETAAERIAACLAEHAPAAHYDLCGYCYGGVVAFATAQLLRSQGKSVRLILLDVPMPGHASPYRQWPVYLRLAVQELLAVPRHGISPETRRKAGELVRRLLWHAALKAKPKASAASMERLLGMSRLPFYKPVRLDAPILHVISEEVEIRPVVDSRMGWSRVAAAGFTEAALPLDHTRVFAESNLPQLAQCIEHFLP